MKKGLKVMMIGMMIGLLLGGCSEKGSKNIELQEGTPVNGELSRVVTYKGTDLIVDGAYISLLTEYPYATAITSVEKVTETIVAITAKIDDEYSYFSFYDIEGDVYMNSVTGSYFYWHEGEMDSLVYFDNGNICNAQRLELVNIEQFGDTVTKMEYDESLTLVTVTICNSQTGGEYESLVRNDWQEEEE